MVISPMKMVTVSNKNCNNGNKLTGGKHFLAITVVGNLLNCDCNKQQRPYRCPTVSCLPKPFIIHLRSDNYLLSSIRLRAVATFFDIFIQPPTITTKMDYEGQKLSEILFYYIIILFGVIGWIYGYFLQDFTYVFYSWGVGVGISILLCVPDWPIYNKHPVKWLESIPDRSQEESKKSK